MFYSEIDIGRNTDTVSLIDEVIIYNLITILYNCALFCLMYDILLLEHPDATSSEFLMALSCRDFFR